MNELLRLRPMEERARGKGDPVPQTRRRRTGKIARLPREHRELIDLMLRDGTPYSKIIQKLADRGHKLDKDHISR